MNRNDPAPTPIFTKEELRYLQDLLDLEKQGWFNFKMEQIDAGRDCEESDRKYHLAKSLRDKVYHLGGRDTLALGHDYHEQRHWDQGHNY